MVFITQDVGQHGKTAAVLDQAHGDARHRSGQRNTRIHHGQGATTDGSHGAGAVGFGDLGHHTNGVGEVFLARQHASQRTLGQTAVADLATLGRAETAAFASGERGEVVVQHEALAVLTGDRIDDLLVTTRAQGGHHQGLGFTAGEQGRTVGTRQHADTDVDGAHGTGVTTIDTRLAAEDATAHDLGFQIEDDVVHGVGVELDTFRRQGLVHFLADGRQLLRTGLLGGDAESFVDLGAGNFGDAGDQGFVLRRSLPVPFGLAGHFNQFVDGLDGSLHLGVAKNHAAQHHVFRQLQGLGFDHQHGGFGTGDHQVHLAGLQLGGRRVEDICTIVVTDATGADRAGKRDAGDGQGRRGSDHRGDVSIHFRIQGHHLGNNLNFVVETFREQRADRAIDQTGSKGFLLGRTAFTLEETTRDTAGSVELFNVIDSKGEEVLTRLGVFGSHNGCQHHGVVHVDDHGTMGLTGNLAGLQGDGVGAVGKTLLDSNRQRMSFHSIGWRQTTTARVAEVTRRFLWRTDVTKPAKPHGLTPAVPMIKPAPRAGLSRSVLKQLLSAYLRRPRRAISSR